MRLGLDLAQHQLEWPELVRRARFAESAGFEGGWVFDHFKALYGDPTGPCFDGWTTMAGLAAVTERIRIGPLVTGVTYRHPSILAAQAVTVDHISGGRLEFSLGAAWFAREHRELGLPFPSGRKRAERLEEAIQVVRLLMTTDDASFEGRHFHLRGATYRPRPVQRPHPPIWVGASGEGRMLPVAGRQADVWHTYGSASALRRQWSIVEEHARRAGRDPSSIVRATSLSISEPWDQVRAHARSVREAGFSYLVVDWPSEGWDRIREFVDTVMPELARD